MPAKACNVNPDAPASIAIKEFIEQRKGQLTLCNSEHRGKSGSVDGIAISVIENSVSAQDQEIEDLQLSPPLLEDVAGPEQGFTDYKINHDYDPVRRNESAEHPFDGINAWFYADRGGRGRRAKPIVFEPFAEDEYTDQHFDLKGYDPVTFKACVRYFSVLRKSFPSLFWT